jgi:hypothetical protein
MTIKEDKFFRCANIYDALYSVTLFLSFLRLPAAGRKTGIQEFILRDLKF